MWLDLQIKYRGKFNLILANSFNFLLKKKSTESRVRYGIYLPSSLEHSLGIGKGKVFTGQHLVWILKTTGSNSLIPGICINFKMINICPNNFWHLRGGKILKVLWHWVRDYLIKFGGSLGEQVYFKKVI